MNRSRRMLIALGGGLALLLSATAPAATAASRSTSAYPIVHFSLHGSGSGHIYLLRGASDVALRAANSNGHDCGPAFRPRTGGRFLVFESNRKTDPYAPSNFEIYLLDLRTGTLKQLTKWPGVDAFPTWSPDGRRIAFSREDPVIGGRGPLSIWVMNADGSSPRKITDGTVQSPHLNPAWSPDGKEIAFTSLADGIQVVDPNGRHLRTLAAGGEFPAWSPDGRWIVFDKARGQTNPYKTDLYVMHADGSHQRLIDHPDGYDVQANWSPDGRHIAYVHGTDYWTGQVLFVMTPTGTGYDVIGSGPGPSQIWQLTLNRQKKVVAREQLSHGPDDLFPHYSPVRNPY